MNKVICIFHLTLKTASKLSRLSLPSGSLKNSTRFNINSLILYALHSAFSDESRKCLLVQLQQLSNILFVLCSATKKISSLVIDELETKSFVYIWFDSPWKRDLFRRKYVKLEVLWKMFATHSPNLSSATCSETILVVVVNSKNFGTL